MASAHDDDVVVGAARGHRRVLWGPEVRGSVIAVPAPVPAFPSAPG
jgi:hypothetical protein